MGQAAAAAARWPPCSVHKRHRSRPASQRADTQPDGWHATFNCSTAKKGYSGTAILSRQAPLSVARGIGAEEHDDEVWWAVGCELRELLWPVGGFALSIGGA